MNLNLDEKEFTKEKAFVVLAAMGGIIAFVVWGFFPKSEPEVIIPSERVREGFLTEYSPLFELGKDVDGNGVPAWREQVFGSNAVVGQNNATSNLTVSTIRDVLVIGSLASKDEKINPDTYLGAAIDGATQKLIRKDVGQINLSADNSRANLKDYGNAAGFMFGLFFGNEQKEIGDVQAYLDSNDVKKLSNVKVFSKETSKVCDDFKAVAAPRDSASLHRELIVECYYFADVLKGLATADSDPMMALISINSYQAMLNTQVSLLEKFKAFFSSKSVIFGPSDTGRIFNSTNN